MAILIQAFLTAAIFCCVSYFIECIFEHSNDTRASPCLFPIKVIEHGVVFQNCCNCRL